ncbi:hypothetical protein [Kitasatospora sp. KL5]|uniref:hypothetical protein n=1 Tax=Kitasatospora sp. KL5 TaxID=3425125 RepID=UPI003D6FECCF
MRPVRTGLLRPLSVMNRFRDVTVAPTASGDNGKLLDRAQRFCRPATRKKPVFPAVDRYDLGNAGAAAAALNTWVDPAPQWMQGQTNDPCRAGPTRVPDRPAGRAGAARRG